MQDIFQYYDILDTREFHEQADSLLNSEWKLLNKPDKDPNSPVFWIRYLNDDKFYTGHLFNIIKETVAKDGFDIELIRVYANGQRFGQPGKLHQDYSTDEQWTFLIYFNHTWDIHWGGHTVIKDINDDKFYSFYPVPNSALFFRGDLWHVGLEPTSVCPLMRTSVAYKFKMKEKSND
jgi:hypothetical protein